MFGAAVKIPVKLPAIHIGVPGFESCCRSNSDFLFMCNWETMMIAQVLGSLPTTWEIQIEFQAPKFSLAQT